MYRHELQENVWKNAFRELKVIQSFNSSIINYLRFSRFHHKIVNVLFFLSPIAI